MLYYLKATLNASYSPEYDFSNARASEFAREPNYTNVARNIEANLLPALGSDYELVRRNLWDALDKSIQPAECEIFSYCGDAGEDPFTEAGTLWNFVYFFYNKRQKKLLFFTCQGMSPTSLGEDEEAYMDDEEMDLADEVMFDDPQFY